MALDASQIPRGGFRLEITPLGRRMLVAYAVVWAVLWITAILRVAWIPMPVGPAGFEVATPTPLRDLLTLTPGDRFGAWQLLSAPFVSATFSSLALGTLGFVFFAAPVERMLGRRGFLQLWFVASIGGALAAWLGSFAFTVGPASFFGMAPAVVATMVVCCMMTPEAVVPFLIVLPVKMRLFAVGIVVLVVISALGINASRAVHLRGAARGLPVVAVGLGPGPPRVAAPPPRATQPADRGRPRHPSGRGR